MKFLTAVIIVSLSCHFLVAEQVTDPAWSSYRVWVRSGNGASGGSATGIAANLVVTNVHVVGRPGVTVEVLHPLRGYQWSGQVVAIDPSADVALVHVTPASLDWVEIGSDPQPGQVCSLYGYGGDSKLKRGVGRYLSADGSRGDGVPVWDAEVESISGDSGSGLFDDQGRLCSVNWGGGDRNESASTPVSYVSRLIDRWRGGGQIAQQPPQQPRPRRPGRMPPKQPILELTPKDPLERFDVDGFVKYLASKVQK